jgi:phospholipid-binding lipoprotein MlaA
MKMELPANPTVTPRAPGACWRVLLWVLALALLSGCATGPNANPRDPLEPFNRGMSKFNEGVDGMVLKPTATVYKKAVPAPVRTGVSNVFNNISDIGSVLNNVFQLKPRASAEMMMRVVINSTYGLWGIFDIASELGIERYPEDFGQTLGRWGVPSGPYLVLPLLGPSTLRDTTALVVDYKADLTGYLDPIGSRTALNALRIVNTRSNLLRLGTMLDEAALDKYSFARDVYLQRRRSMIADGEESDGGELPPLPPLPPTD